MVTSPDLQRYSRPAVLFHWVIFLLVATAYFAIEMRGPKGSESRVLWTSVHFWAGTLVLALALPRLLWRLWRRPPDDLSSSRVVTFLSRLMHLLLYIFIFLQPILGILMINTAGHPLTLAGLNYHITLTGPSQEASKVIKEVHEFIGNAFYWVIGLHALAAIGHHIVLKGASLRRMM
ncbi:cytochrome b [Paraburkholderia humisilvae]|uniref:Cytochrome b561 n=1 Tax=Paraburkholderia humisilvae TaxID=627669 RepID=A0A6J5F3N3_9BURK|nr:cytochrome b [Paraburkholderia humisilvae]CAB3773044.1 Cytochrome b561 [Paraburkholderia humisilvae]